MAVRDVALSLYEEQERIVRAAVQAAASLFNLLDPAAFTALVDVARKALPADVNAPAA